MIKPPFEVFEVHLISVKAGWDASPRGLTLVGELNQMLPVLLDLGGGGRGGRVPVRPCGHSQKKEATRSWQVAPW